MFDFQTDAIFPTHAVPRPAPLPARARLLELRTADGHTLKGVYIPPLRTTAGRTLVLGFAGNAWNSQDVALYLADLYPETDVIAFHYRGYHPSTGSPSAHALFADAPLIYDLAIEEVDPERVVAVGLSIGSGVAAHLASKRDLDGIILVTPFDSLKAVAAGIYPMLPVGLMFRHEMDSAAALRRNNVPVAIVAGGNDTLIPPVRTDTLRKAVRNLVFDRTIARAGHNDLYQRPDFRIEMREALKAVTSN